MAVTGTNRLNNVKASILSDSFDESLGMNVYGLPVKTDLRLTYVDTYYTPEGTRQGIHERDVAVRYRFIYNTPSITSFIPKSGMAIRVDYIKHPTTKTWVPVVIPKIYVIKYVAETFPGSKVYDIGAALHGEE
jgi:hypothetical protein